MNGPCSGCGSTPAPPAPRCSPTGPATTCSSPRPVTRCARTGCAVRSAGTSLLPVSTSEGSCHLLRHTVATLMLEGGADIRYVAEMLGHASLETTQRYTHVSIDRLRTVHATTHPAAGLNVAMANELTAMYPTLPNHHQPEVTMTTTLAARHTPSPTTRPPTATHPTEPPHTPLRPSPLLRPHHRTIHRRRPHRRPGSARVARPIRLWARQPRHPQRPQRAACAGRHR